VFVIREKILADGLPCDTLVMGGTPTFSCHAKRHDVFLSPGALFINDHGYQTAYRDLLFEPAAVLLTRVISRPSEDLFTLDLGYKAIGADPVGKKGIIVALPDAVPVSQSEEHWVFRLKNNNRYSTPRVGDVHYVIPTHICSTTALHSEVLAVRDSHVAEVWLVNTRNRRITV
jgi:D-serine deaminase-like pyridoxal phosphate-dependent protein